MNVQGAARHRSIACCLAVVVIGVAQPVLAKGGKKKPSDVAAPVVEHTPVAKHDGKGPVVVDVEIVDDSAIFEPTLLVRNPGAPAFMRVPLVKKADASDVWSAEVPVAMLSGDVEYLVEAFDEHGNGPARVGDENAPLKIVRDVPVVAPADPGPVKPTPPPEEEGASTALIVTGVIVGTVVLLGAAAGTTALVYFARPEAPTSVAIAVSAPSPVGAQ